MTLVLVREQEAAPWQFDGLAHLRVEGLDDARRERFDIAIATWWETVYTLFELDADRYVHFIQSLEDRFYDARAAERHAAAGVLDLPVSYITEASWIAETIRQSRADAPVALVRNGIDKDVFRSPEQPRGARDEPPRIVVEGNPQVWFKGVYPAISVCEKMREPRHLTVVTGDHSRIAPGTADAVVGPLSHREMAALYGASDVVLEALARGGHVRPAAGGLTWAPTCRGARHRLRRVHRAWLERLGRRLGRHGRHGSRARPARARPAAADLPAHERAGDGAHLADVGAVGRLHGRRAGADPPRPAAAGLRRRAPARRRQPHGILERERFLMHERNEQTARQARPAAEADGRPAEAQAVARAPRDAAVLDGRAPADAEAALEADRLSDARWNGPS